MSDCPASSRYHHGDLRATLLRAAEAHIEQEGTERLSLRALAREAGVSATAPYRHFDDRQGLLVALATEGFEELGAVNAQVLEAEGRAPLQRQLVSLALGYVHYAESHRVKYLLMFGDILGDFSPYPELVQASDQAFSPLATMLESGLRQGVIAPMPLWTLAGATWAAVHGVAGLILKGQGRSAPAETRRAQPLLALDALEAQREAAFARLFLGFFACPKAQADLQALANCSSSLPGEG